MEVLGADQILCATGRTSITQTSVAEKAGVE